MFRPLRFLFPFFLAGVAYAQGPISGFPVAKGETAIALGYSREAFDVYLLPEDQRENREVTTVGYSLFLERGMSDNTSLVATLPYLRANDRPGSLQDASLWLKYLNLENRAGRACHRLFTAVGLSFPVGNYETAGITALGQRALVFQGRLAYQYQHDSGWFLHGQTGIDFQFSPASQTAWPVLLRTGYGGKYFYVEGWAEFVTALAGGAGPMTAAVGTGSSWQRLGATLYIPLQDWVGVVAGGAWVLDGEFIGKSERVNLGVVFKF
ncbi:hypothetical protein QWY85_20640 [Neolewinella lacunae]|uniref:Transporter n=1 Tax=Neolewinella lacunae TaxID=1517758 RepID=A0A923PGT3_9BACT|nr:hypothetical protein [Neolewinella lacunae]MBC6993848.1 hypothetical protein [Neolewinella lacunae]MDN3637091.1 hypothetical protein [Neolewinella lacunae]